MHKKTKGSIAELAVASRLMKDGWRIALPYGENTRYDLVAERDGRFVRIQVKYVTPKNGKLHVQSRSSNNWSVLAYTAKQIDAIAAYNPVDDSVYFIPVKDIGRTATNLRLDPPKNNQKAKVRYARDYGVLRERLARYLI